MAKGSPESRVICHPDLEATPSWTMSSHYPAIRHQPIVAVPAVSRLNGRGDLNHRGNLVPIRYDALDRLSLPAFGGGAAALDRQESPPPSVCHDMRVPVALPRRRDPPRRGRCRPPIAWSLHHAAEPLSEIDTENRLIRATSGVIQPVGQRRT